MLAGGFLVDYPVIRCHNFNPWSPVRDSHGSSASEDQSQNADAAEQKKPKGSVFIRVLANIKVALFHSWVNVLLVFVPVGIAIHFAGVNQNVVFAINAIAIIPLAGLLTFATESVAHRLGPTLGALLNNAVCVPYRLPSRQPSSDIGYGLFDRRRAFQEQIYDSTVTQMSACLLALAVLSLLIPTAFHASFSDLEKADHAVIKLSRGSSVILLIIYVLYLLFQLKSHAYLYQGTPQHIIDEEATPGVLQRLDSTTSSPASSSRSSATSAGSHRRVSKRLRAKLDRRREVKTGVENDADSEEAVVKLGQNVTDDQGEKTVEAQETKSRDASMEGMPPNPPAASAKDKKPNIGPRGLSFRPPPVFRSSTHPSPRGKEAKYLSHPLRHYQSAPDQQSQSPGAARIVRRSSPTNSPAQEDAPPMSQTASIILLLASTGLVALCAEFLVGSIEHLVEDSPLSEAFIGLIILPIVGNAAEHVTAVTVAAKNKLDLALGVSLGSSIQIALFVTPFVVILGWIMDKDMSLYFSLFETGSLFVSTFIVNFLVLDGRSNYLEGALLCACYVIVAVGAYFFPDGQDQSSLTSGPSN
ncbi:calcium/proton exchanger [Cladophialophora bantiana CBS 173.52]|uniref:Calcium/proton exchanger n=1 Tax=Cladophialophora bantiana (strain ATCC 10958 / CBS 173.52 / CDC B-1940 / NIH 8579) TaxID=1442370 RepID=A0A0D2F1I2_CLAB1|nr:calcium/proton exchanger [Cladophialophora bantiana CBS 173.52]KIW96011.1 calcium/proton exchanger [Cladophialophora bantiana CBS 173.52]